MEKELIEGLREAVRDWMEKKSAANLYALKTRYAMLVARREEVTRYARVIDSQGGKSSEEMIRDLTLDDLTLERTLVAMTEALRADWVSRGFYDETGMEPDAELVATLFDELLARDDYRGDKAAMRNLFMNLSRYGLISDPVLFPIFEYILDFAVKAQDYNLAVMAAEQMLSHSPSEDGVSLDTIAKCVPFHKDGYVDGAFDAADILRAFEIFDGTSAMSYVVNNFGWYMHMFEDPMSDWATEYPDGLRICLEELESAGKHKEASALRDQAEKHRCPPRKGFFYKLFNRS